jgi:glycosyltransferase involved in cell wall biosynthesis
MPSLLESFGNVWAEAMASGTPVVGSLLSAGPEIVPHDIAGLLVDPRNPAQVAEAVTTLMTSQSLRYRLGLAGRRLARDKYSVEVTGENTMSFYKQLTLETSTN